MGARSHAEVGDQRPQGGHRVPGGAVGDTATGPGPPIQGSGKRNREDGRCRHGGENWERSVHGNGDVRGVDVGPGRRLSGCGSPSGQETGRQRGTEQEGGRRPRGWRKNSGKARGHGGGGGGRKPDPARDCPDVTCVPRGYRGCAGALREWAPAVPAVGPKLPSMPGKGLSRVRLRLQTPLCRPWGVAGRGVPARQPHARTCSLLPQRGRSCNRLRTTVGRRHKPVCPCQGQDPRDPPAVAGEAVLLPTGLLAGV